MLRSLSIRNIILIDSIDLELRPGLNVLTGETGAGKSILLDALGFALGNRASAQLLKTGEMQGSVTAVFDGNNNHLHTLLEEQGIPLEDELYIRRNITADGKTKAWVNDTPVSIGLLAQLTEFLLEIHGQHDQRGLLDNALHREILDEYGKLHPQKTKVKETWENYSKALQQYQNLQQQAENRQQQLELLQHQVKELEQLAPQKGEEALLAVKRTQLMHKEKLIQLAQSSLRLLQEPGDIGDILRSTAHSISRQESFHTSLKNIASTLEKASFDVNDAIRELEGILHALEEGEENADIIEERLYSLRNLARKHHVTPDELAEISGKLKEQLQLLENAEYNLSQLEKQITTARTTYLETAGTLSEARRKAADKLATALHKELKPLKMENTKFRVAIEELPESNWNEEGTDRIFFEATTNPGLPFAPLSKIASGGELSRFMLALKVVLSNLKSVSTMIFDEIDTGIGGAVADAVGNRLSLLGENKQVLVITHHPQVAAKASYHIKITKIQKATTTKVQLAPLSEEQRKEELARMLAGAIITPEARAAAEKLLVG